MLLGPPCHCQHVVMGEIFVKSNLLNLYSAFI